MKTDARDPCLESARDILDTTGEETVRKAIAMSLAEMPNDWNTLQMGLIAAAILIREHPGLHTQGVITAIQMTMIRMIREALD